MLMAKTSQKSHSQPTQTVARCSAAERSEVRRTAIKPLCHKAQNSVKSHHPPRLHSNNFTRFGLIPGTIFPEYPVNDGPWTWGFGLSGVQPGKSSQVKPSQGEIFFQ